MHVALISRPPTYRCSLVFRNRTTTYVNYVSILECLNASGLLLVVESCWQENGCSIACLSEVWHSASFRAHSSGNAMDGSQVSGLRCCSDPGLVLRWASASVVHATPQLPPWRILSAVPQLCRTCLKPRFRYDHADVLGSRQNRNSFDAAPKSRT